MNYCIASCVFTEKFPQPSEGIRTVSEITYRII